MEAWRSRRAALLAGGAGYVLASVNEGAAAGASLDHSHSQLVPFPDPPPRIVQEAAAFRAGCPLCPLPGTVVHEQDGLVAFCPPFARVPFETWIAPIRPPVTRAAGRGHGPRTDRCGGAAARGAGGGPGLERPAARGSAR